MCNRIRQCSINGRFKSCAIQLNPNQALLELITVKLSEKNFSRHGKNLNYFILKDFCQTITSNNIPFIYKKRSTLLKQNQETIIINICLTV